ncbi:hypothetical protein [Haliovirga abyssi]|uniref:Uncharacterized protein n=1 Tax=Haliovirga abyssi TaxID=2996794 RepID=A0AAU9DXT8_9FUSO|nr:hypothetical protein [Haliovirga abyssi]BDU51316.1 hypothetical protein HLVA_18850 [Haliovirga abyssi]
MKKRIIILLGTLVLMLNLGGCFSSTTPETEEKNIEKSIVITSDKLEIEANGVEKTTLKAIEKDGNGVEKEITTDIAYYVNGESITGNVFTTTKEGEYSIKAKYKDLESNILKIKAVKTPVKISDKAVVLDEDTKNKIDEVDIDNNKIIFSVGEEIPYKKDDIIVSGVSDKFPKGLLVKVDSIIEKNGKKEIIFKPAKITDVVEQAKVNKKIKLTKNDIKRVSTNYRGIKISRVDEARDMVCQINTVVYDEDNDENTTDDQIKLEGELSIDPGIDFDIDISGFTIKEFGFGVDSNISGNLKITGNLHKTWDKEVKLISYSFMPFNIFIGNVPIVITPSMYLVVGSNGEINGKFKYSLSEQATAEVKISYSNGEWGGKRELNNNFDFSQPEIEANAKFKMYTGAKFEVALYTNAVLAGTGKVLLYFRGEADIDKNPWWNVYGGIEAIIGFNGLGLDGYEYTMPIYEKKIVSAEYFNDGDGEYKPEEVPELEKGWIKKYKFYGNIPTMDEILSGAEMPENPIMLMGYYDYKDIVTNGENGFMALASAPFQFSMLTNYDKDGNIIFNKFAKVKVEGEKLTLFLNKIKKISDGYIVAGITGEGVIIAKLNENGESVWGKVLNVDVGGLTLETHLAKITQDKFIVSFGGSFMIVNSNGVIEKKEKMTYNVFPDQEGEEGVFVDIIGAAPVKDGYVVIGNVNRGVFIPQGVMIKYDENWNKVWDKYIIIDNLDDDQEALATRFDSIVTSEDEGFYISGWAEKGGFIAKFSQNGDLKWNRVMNEIDYPFTDLEVVADVGVIGMAKVLIDEGYATDFIKFSSDGVYGWSKRVTGEGESVEFNGVFKRDDNKMLYAAGAIGEVDSNGYKSKNPALLSVTPTGEIELKTTTLKAENFINSVLTNVGIISDVGTYEISDLNVEEKDAELIMQDCKEEFIDRY